MRRLERTAGALSLAAALIHGGLAPAHFSEWWGYGLFFAAAAAAQAVFGLLLLTRGLQVAGRSWEDLRPLVYAAGIAGNLAIMLLWLVTRTVGIPWLGPEAGTVEGIGPIDTASKILEGALVVLLLRLWVLARRPRGVE
jgi:hypothetical protein